MDSSKSQLRVEYIPVTALKENEYNPKKFSKESLEAIKESIVAFGFVDTLVVNGADHRRNILIGGHARLKIAKELGYETVPVVYVNIPVLEKEKELNLRLHKNQGEFDFELLSKFDESFLSDVGFTSEELDEVFKEENDVEQFDLKKELEKMNIKQVKVQKGDIYEIDGSRLMCGDSTIETDMLKLMDNNTASMVCTDPPYLLDYLKGKTKQKDGVTV